VLLHVIHFLTVRFVVSLPFDLNWAANAFSNLISFAPPRFGYLRNHSTTSLSLYSDCLLWLNRGSNEDLPGPCIFREPAIFSVPELQVWLIWWSFLGNFMFTCWIASL
jgi:hypothetical protein